jgi:hypothetical protein
MGFYIPEDDILHSHCRENIKSYKLMKLLQSFTGFNFGNDARCNIPQDGMSNRMIGSRPDWAPSWWRDSYADSDSWLLGTQLPARTLARVASEVV